MIFVNLKEAPNKNSVFGSGKKQTIAGVFIYLLIIFMTGHSQMFLRRMYNIHFIIVALLLFLLFELHVVKIFGSEPSELSIGLFSINPLLSGDTPFLFVLSLV